MKRNKHINVVQEKAPETAQEKTPESNTLIMTDSDGKLVQAKGIQLSKDFAKIAEKITAAKGGQLDPSVKALLEMTEIWTPDMVVNDAAEEKPKAADDAEEKPKAADDAEEKPKAKRTRKPKAVDGEEKPKKATRKKTTTEEKPKRTRKPKAVKE